MFVTNSKNGFSLKAYKGSQMTLLTMNFDEQPSDGSFAGFTISYINPKGDKNFIQNLLNFKGTTGVTGSDISPIQLFRWVHFPGSYQQTGLLSGVYTYEATPRYLDKNKNLLSLDPSSSVSLKIEMGDLNDGNLSVGFTRAFLKSQAFAYRYGDKQKLLPGGDWIFDTNQEAGTNKYGPFTYEDMYVWLGYSARKYMYAMFEEALNDDAVTIDMFAYDLNDPVICNICLQLAAKGKIRIILDNADLHTGTDNKGNLAKEDDFENRFKKKAINGAEVYRCKFARFVHCKVVILKRSNIPYKVLTGSTNFSFTGLYVNANHVLVFNNADVAQYYDDVFNACWKNGSAHAFRETEYSNNAKEFTGNGITNTKVNFSPHTPEYAKQPLDEITAEVKNARSVLFSVMEMGEKSSGSLIKTLREIHEDDSIYSYGVTDDSSNDISLYKPGSKKGILVNAKAASRELPPPFHNEHSLPGHAIHHKFVVTDFNKDTAKVYCGSSNLALGGETDNGDNLLCIEDTDVAIAFAIEALRLTDHYNYRSLKDKEDKSTGTGKPAHLDDTGTWFKRFFDPNDIRCVERELFA